jgi:hypothetical protein
MKRTVFAALLVGLVAALAAPARADRAADDLAAVKKAVGGDTAASRPAAEQAESRPAARAKAGEGKWLRVRITERAGKHGKVSINLPLGLARALGEDWHIRGCGECGGGHGMTLGEILRALDSGQSLVEIDDDEASVRVWVD